MRWWLVALVLAGCGNAPDLRDLGVPVDAATVAPGGDGGIGCGASDCLIGGDEVCCVEPALRYCAPASACSSGVPAYCDGPEDCAGAVCCLPTNTMQVVCRTQCDGVTVCHVDGDCPASAPHCCPELASGYGGCATGC